MPAGCASKLCEICHRVSESAFRAASLATTGANVPQCHPAAACSAGAHRRTLVDMGWFERAKKASAGQRVTKADERHAMAVFDELNIVNAERERLTRDGLAAVATITEIREIVATTALGTWHELVLEVALPNHDAYRATRRVSVELSTSPHIRIGAQLEVRVDPQDRSKVLVVAGP
jgi:hypothetical protein